MELIILLFLATIIILVFKRFSAFIYFIAIIDIFFRIVTYIKLQITQIDIYNILDKYIPNSIPSLIDKYSTGIINTLVMWLYVIAFIIFEYYIIRTFFKKK